ncbi:lipase family protein [Undibacterium cyanobacteriorum]|uniref:Lipase family protein n=1 Tax=Undibacterium cyanobacteriorum TaxID=3073561 RepID=A0ABY9RGC8_9BURK|nr:lipase family protein [Undibacterium sp. 20NA77.5]WMW80283.1 lipase family protein [Undibacterium sp. 20NA77.5]
MWWMSKAWRELLLPGLADDFFVVRLMPNLDLQIKEYHLGNALACAELSRLVYRHDVEEEVTPPQPTRREFLRRGGFEQLAFFQDQLTHTQAMLVRHTSLPLRVLVFRGTEQDIRDFITDCDVGALPLLSANNTEALVHRGFERALDSIWQQIETSLRESSEPIWVTGHSLGAALATLACRRFSFATCYTYGSPRVGNQAFVEQLPAMPIFRVVDDEDLVCKVPIEAMGFAHAGTCIQLRGTSTGLGFASLINPVKALADHAPRRYLERL